MEYIYVIEGLMSAFGSYEDAEKFRKWYNKKYAPNYYIEPSDIEKRYCFYSVEDAMEWGIEPDAY